MQPLKPQVAVRLVLNQIELVERLLKELGTDNSGFTIDNVMKVSEIMCLQVNPGESVNILV